MKNLAVIIIVLAILALAFYLGSRNRPTGQPAITTPLPEQPEKNSPSVAQKIPSPQPAVIGTERAAVAVLLPDLDQSDAMVREELAGLSADAQLEQLFTFESAIRRFVVIVDNLTAAKLPQKFRFTRPPQDKFQVQHATDGGDYIAPANYERYTPYVRFIEDLDITRTAALYHKLYPLLQQAYAELGYPDRRFNDRVLEVIDHLLASPAVTGPVKLLQPSVYYTYADENLEALSSGQKLLLRIGPANASKVKGWLLRLRGALVTGK